MNVFFGRNKFFLILFFLIFSLCGANRPLRILFVVGYFPVLSETFILNQITTLIDRGHDVTILSFRKGDFKKVHPDIKKYKLLKKTKFGNLLRNHRSFDIVYCQFGYHGKRIINLIRKNCGPKGILITCFRGSDITTYIKRWPGVYRQLFKRGAIFLPVCNFFKQRLIDMGCKPCKIIVHHSAIDCSHFSFKKRRKEKNDYIHIISVCRLVEKKGINYAIKAMAQVIKKHPEITYTIIGDGPERERLERLIKKYNLEDKITLYGWATRNEVIHMLNDSHIFILPSVTAKDGNQEGIPNVLKEAMAMGLPVVSTFHSGISELVEDGVSGLLVPERDVKQLAQKIEYLIKNPELWGKMGAAGRKKVEQEFEIEKTVDELEQLFYFLVS